MDLCSCLFRLCTRTVQQVYSTESIQQRQVVSSSGGGDHQGQILARSTHIAWIPPCSRALKVGRAPRAGKIWDEQHKKRLIGCVGGRVMALL